MILFTIPLFISLLSTHALSIPTDKTISTHIGDISIRIVGDENHDKIPVIAIPGASPLLQDEWMPIAHILSENGYVVYILNIHSNHNAKKQMVRIIHEAVLHNTIGESKAIIMGKSYGGAVAQAFAVAHPEEVIKLCLVAPASSDESMISALYSAHIKVFLAWARDDTNIPFSNTAKWRESYKSGLTLHSVAVGGHRVLEEYAKPILEFLQK